ncbi:MAG: hypothetical protein LC799_24090, partial [Actinobacteria bacterium]|nr:hypothetical protein [Actinomycetota bacterium]
PTSSFPLGPLLGGEDLPVFGGADGVATTTSLLGRGPGTYTIPSARAPHALCHRITFDERQLW